MGLPEIFLEQKPELQDVAVSDTSVAISDSVVGVIDTVVKKGEGLKVIQVARKDLPFLGPKLATDRNKLTLALDLESYFLFKETQRQKPSEKEFFDVFMEGKLEIKPKSPFRADANSWRKNKKHIWIIIKDKVCRRLGKKF